MRKFRDAPLTAFSDVPPHYHEGARPTWHQRRRHRAVFALLHGLTGDVLDFGCGYGDLTYAMSSEHRATGIDVNPRRIEFARHEYASVDFRVFDGATVPFPEGSFDIVTSIVVIDFVPDAADHLQMIRHLLRDGGHLILGWQNHFVVRNWFRARLGRGPAPSEVQNRSMAEVRSLLAEAGFTVEAESYFYDPPLSHRRTVGDVIIGGVQQCLSALSVSAAADYLLVRAKKGPA